MPGPTATPQIQVFGRTGATAPPDQWDSVDIQGDVCTDSSCDQNWIPDLRKSGWVTLGADGNNDYIVECSVPATHAQTPQTAEYGCLAGLASCATGVCNCLSDCLGVVNARSKVRSPWQTRNKKHAALTHETRQPNNAFIKHVR